MAKGKVVAIAAGKGKRDAPGGGSGGGAEDAPDWRRQLTYNREGGVSATPHNLALILENDEELAELFWLDEFQNAVMLSRTPPWTGGVQHDFTEVDATELSVWLGHPERYTMNCGMDLILQVVEAVARRRKRHPVREYLRALEWDGVPRVRRMFVDLFGAEDLVYNLDAAECFMVSAVARILHVDPKTPSKGAKVDFMLVLEGKQGVGKSTSLLELFGGGEWYAEATESPASKDFYQALRGRWCVEIGEMDSFSKADVTLVKRAITTRTDSYRPSYARLVKSFRRECVFAGTTNEAEYLRDPTGGRRFLPVVARSADIAGIVAVRDQLWAEAVSLFDGGREWHKLPATVGEEQDKRYQADSWEEVIERWLKGKAPSPDKQYPPRLQDVTQRVAISWTTTTELLIGALNLDVAKHGKPEQMRLAAVMKRLGWVHKRGWFDGNRERRWVREDAGDGGDSDVPF